MMENTHIQPVIRKALADDVKNIVHFVDSTFTKEGYGFVTSAQISTETARGAVWIAEHSGEIIGVRVGINRVYNLVVHPDFRKMGIGRDLIAAYSPDVIRVKAIPVGNLSQEQRDNFKSPEGFYESIGFKYVGDDFARNFYQRGKEGDAAHFHKVGSKKHIKIYKNKTPRQLDLFDANSEETP